MKKIFVFAVLVLALTFFNAKNLFADEEAKISTDQTVNINKRHSIYDEVRPSSVNVPGKIHLSEKKSSLDMSIPIGDVMFNPIPSTTRR